jgi:phosphotransferase system enzyme I (PtsP)
VTISAASFNEGVGLGHVVLHEPRIVVTNLFNEDSEEEVERLEGALGSLRLSLDDMLSRRDVAFEGEHRAVLEAYRMFADDTGWVRRLQEAIRNGLTAEAAVEKVQSDMRARMLHMTDPYLRERMSDFDDLANRLLRLLMGHGPETLAASLPRDAIIVARSMGAAELLDYPRGKLRGLVLEDGAITSHVVIVARAMGIPVAGQARGAVSMAENGDAVIVDGVDGLVHLRPTSDVEAAYAEKVRFRARRQELYRELRKKPSVTRDGVAIDLMMNAGLAVDLPQLAESGAAGIGLFRTELQFMVASTFPRAEAQERLYRDVLDAAAGKPVTFRTIDIGGDKVLPYFKVAEQEENPALGWRAVRLTLDRPGLMRTQMRALLKAAGGRELRVMLPMVTEIAEIRQAREIIDREVRHLARFAHHLPTTLKLGAMIEVPSLMWQLEELMDMVDFVSVGSNDLFQFVTATDRGNSRVGDRFDPLCVPFLRLLRQITEAGREAGTPVTLCGELAGRPISAMALLGIGYRSISMSPAAIGPVKAMLAELPLEALTALMDDTLNAPTCEKDVRAMLAAFAAENDIPL